MDDEFIEFQDFVEDFFNLELESEVVDESLFSFQEIRENNPILGSLYERSFPLKIQELKKNQVGDKTHLLTGIDQNRNI